MVTSMIAKRLSRNINLLNLGVLYSLSNDIIDIGGTIRLVFHKSRYEGVYACAILHSSFK
jgi:hypothetical protein